MRRSSVRLHDEPGRAGTLARVESSDICSSTETVVGAACETSGEAGSGAATLSRGSLWLEHVQHGLLRFADPGSGQDELEADRGGWPQ